MEPQILFKDAYTKDGDIYFPALIAEGDHWNENGICYPSSLLEKWHKEDAVKNLAHNAHPTGNHPLAYEDSPPDEVAESAKVEYYRKKSHDWGFGTYVKSILKTLENGSKRLIGIFKITDAGAKKAWNEGKFPKFVSSSAFVHQKDSEGRITDASLVGVSSVKTPAYPPHIAGVDKQCVGGDECLSKLAESSSKRDHFCMYCRHTVLSEISSHSNEKLSESSMGNEDSGSAASPPQESTGDALKFSETQTSADGKKTEQVSGEEEIDYKSKYEELEKQHKELNKLYKTEKENSANTSSRLEKIEKDNVKSKIRNLVDKVPLVAFDNKEENREEAVNEFMKFYPRLNESEILEQVSKRYYLAPKILEVASKGKLKESGISDNGKLVIPEDETNQDVSILDATEVFGE